MSLSEINLNELENEDITLDALTQNWNIFQLKRGHRFSADDLFTADLALQLCPEATRLCDIGSGLGTVGLLVLASLPTDSTLVMVEAQQVSHQLAKKTLKLNGLQHRVEARYGDLREASSFKDGERFPLVTGSPPYIPVGRGVMSPHPQRAACRMELRGSIFDYSQCAANILTEDGTFVVCFSGTDPRGEASIKAAGLHLRVRQDVIFRSDLAPTITVLAAQKTPGPIDIRSPIYIRDAARQFTHDYMAMRRRLKAPI